MILLKKPTVLSEKEGIELVLCTRNKDTLYHLSKKYRIQEIVHTVDELIAKNIDAAFVSTATEAHAEIAEKLLIHGVHTYIDKPISMNFKETEKIVRLAKKSNKIAMVGFNRRFIPKIKELKNHGKANFILIQKNRFASPDHVRRFVVEDFIHVVDTLRFLMPSEVEEVTVDYVINDHKMDHLVLHLKGKGCTAIGIMNRNEGVTEEIIEYSTGQHKYVVNNLVETTHFHHKEIRTSKIDDWEPTLQKRGFYQIIDSFLDSVEHQMSPEPSIDDSLLTHEICERIVALIDVKN
ncbi:Gfo/Idh/MocA family protein [Salipaludibacillus neizhouensis]|uniref:Gfo/Idh/MocA family protein n=1 Tax=Salipaludibacillus neizhouensis TaxID=885475 RepID=UPI001CBA66DB|nr:Gfo/Idh/MocA family oxidoreductase [Salipaludibacillus neizhouensis]